MGQARLGVEHCATSGVRFVVVKNDVIAGALPLDVDLAAEGSDWEPFATRFRGVPAHGAAISSLLFHRRVPSGASAKDQWALVVVAYDGTNLSEVARINPPAGDTILSHALEDLDGDGVPELRIGIAKQFHGERDVQTFALGPRGFDHAWRDPQSTRGARRSSLCQGADRAIHKADPNAPDHIPCDPVLDFERVRVTTPDGENLLLATGPYAACDGRGCPVIVVRDDRAPDVLLRTFGFLAVDASESRLAITVQKTPGEDDGAHHFCFQKRALGRCDGVAVASRTPWASLAPIRDRSAE